MGCRDFGAFSRFRGRRRGPVEDGEDEGLLSLRVPEKKKTLTQPSPAKAGEG
jgi:hypothetical protein